MASPQQSTADVRDMLCAQALAVVAAALDRLPSGGVVAVAYGAPDVRQDLIAWAAQRGHAVQEPAPGRLLIVRRA
jgi:TusA-related sulfurtransferase